MLVDLRFLRDTISVVGHPKDSYTYWFPIVPCMELTAMVSMYIFLIVRTGCLRTITLDLANSVVKLFDGTIDVASLEQRPVTSHMIIFTRVKHVAAGYGALVAAERVSNIMQREFCHEQERKLTGCRSRNYRPKAHKQEPAGSLNHPDSSVRSGQYYLYCS